jgi:Kef-type K+ transport system membrane component KefB
VGSVVCFPLLLLAILTVAGFLARSINLPGIVGTFLAGLAVNATVHDKPAKGKLEFFANSFHSHFLYRDRFPDRSGLVLSQHS